MYDLIMLTYFLFVVGPFRDWGIIGTRQGFRFSARFLSFFLFGFRFFVVRFADDLVRVITGPDRTTVEREFFDEIIVLWQSHVEYLQPDKAGGMGDEPTALYDIIRHVPHAFGDREESLRRQDHDDTAFPELRDERGEFGRVFGKEFISVVDDLALVEHDDAIRQLVHVHPEFIDFHVDSRVSGDLEVSDHFHATRLIVLAHPERREGLTVATLTENHEDRRFFQ
jgi:hypothetical protein